MIDILIIDLTSSVTERKENSFLKPCNGLILENFIFNCSLENLNFVCTPVAIMLIAAEVNITGPAINKTVIKRSLITSIENPTDSVGTVFKHPIYLTRILDM